ncbi:hypothetical protein A0O31_02394 (plasmid) [Thermus brockianus]|uniref:Uncharacterized protein n=1 Tax=Thermus brockianus TaxID=56956 RepID=A0A1J0LXT9_THEBO|nr:hypothetical protein A0O31_02394 [Thermus brockianus]
MYLQEESYRQRPIQNFFAYMNFGSLVVVAPLDFRNRVFMIKGSVVMYFIIIFKVYFLGFLSKYPTRIAKIQ